MRSLVIGSTVFLATLGSARAQGFNIDIGCCTPPSAGYGSIAAQPGTWNLIPATANSTALVDVTGVASAATISCNPPGVESSLNALPGADGALLNDMQELGYAPALPPTYTWTVTGIANGNYRVTFYSALNGPVAAGSTEFVLQGGAAGALICTGPPVPGFFGFRYGAIFTQDSVTVTNGVLSWTARAAVDDGAFNGVQIAPIVEGSVLRYCTAKVNSLGCVPAISWTDTPSIATNTFRVQASNVLNNSSGLLLWGHNANGLPFHGGNLCVGGLKTRTPLQHSGGNAPPVDCSGTYSFRWNLNYLNAHGLAAGDLVYCQYWYRDPALQSGDGFTRGLMFVLAP